MSATPTQTSECCYCMVDIGLWSTMQDVAMATPDLRKASICRELNFILGMLWCLVPLCVLLSSFPACPLPPSPPFPLPLSFPSCSSLLLLPLLVTPLLFFLSYSYFLPLLLLLLLLLSFILQDGCPRVPTIIMEPESQLYSDPVLVLDFQSLYHSMVIAHNYCFSTCLGRVTNLYGWQG